MQRIAVHDEDGEDLTVIGDDLHRLLEPDPTMEHLTPPDGRTGGERFIAAGHARQHAPTTGRQRRSG